LRSYRKKKKTMKTWRGMIKRGVSLAVMASVLGFSPKVFAQTPEDVKALQAEIQNKKAAIEGITKKLDEYKKKINDYSKQTSSLYTEIALIENETAMSELDIAATQNEIEASQLELQLLSTDVEEADARLAKERAMLGDMVFAIHEHDLKGSTFELILGAKTFDEVFRVAADLESVNGDLKKTLVATEGTREDLEEKKTEQAEKLESLQSLESELQHQIDVLDGRRNAKEILARETSQSEEEYRELLSDLRAEQQSITSRISQLQNEVDNRIHEEGVDDADASTISWPVKDFRITTLFHDPTYPFRYLFEHSGMDLAVPQGTPVGAAAPGVVAWARTGRDYGNYVMIIHANGKATLYAHLSRIDVEQDQYVSRGEIIGLSGGRPGTPGAGFSTGPHVHFELRQDGIPINPLPFLPN
jgi:murein DD-endopeptidase MepM/ murein hydrolase activator NlpD